MDGECRGRPTQTLFEWKAQEEKENKDKEMTRDGVCVLRGMEIGRGVGRWGIEIGIARYGFRYI